MSDLEQNLAYGWYDIVKPIRNLFRRWYVFVWLFFLVLFIGMLTVEKVTERSQFCASCHTEDGVWATWYHSNHKEVACVTCHIEPTVESFIDHKWEGLTKMIRIYTTGKYDPPYHQIRNSSCLQSGCHSMEEITLDSFLQADCGISFSHEIHLSNSPDSIPLLCSSCHTDGVDHQRVRYETCYLCHFQGTDVHNESFVLSGCTGCHPPQQIQNTTLVENGMDHRQYESALHYKESCQQCHQENVDGIMHVEWERCDTCHQKISNFEHLTEASTSVIHETHIVTERIACSSCHPAMGHHPTSSISSLQKNARNFGIR